jgi:DNA-binding CsgD family transcriptional regulator
MSAKIQNIGFFIGIGPHPGTLKLLYEFIRSSGEPTSCLERKEEYVFKNLPIKRFLQSRPHGTHEISTEKAMNGKRRKPIACLLFIGLALSLRAAAPEDVRFVHISRERGLQQNTVIAILQDHNGFIWVGTENGLNRFDGYRFTAFLRDPTDAASLSHGYVMSLCEDRSGILWFGSSDDGISRYNPNRKRFSHFRSLPGRSDSLGSSLVWSFCEDPPGTLWIGTQVGLDRMDLKRRTLTRITSPPTDRHGDLWIGTWGGGLNKLDRKTGTFSRFTRADSLASNNIYGILEDESGNLWFSTNEGVSRFSPRTRQFRNYDVSDGLQSKEFNGGAYLRCRSGEMVFGGANGFNAFFPQDIFDNAFIPPVRITSFKLMNREVRLERTVWDMGEIELSAKDSLFSFEFAALDYSAPEKNQYAYKLDGLTEEWIPTDSGHRWASFSLLPPGRYVFRVKGSNSDGVWNEEGISLVIRVRGPWWRSWWFLSLLAVLLGLFLLQRRRTQVKRMAARIRTEAAMDQLFVKFNISPREKEILFLLLKGRTNKEIGTQLFIELSTVKIHIHHVFRKLGVANRTQLLRLFQNLQVK